MKTLRDYRIYVIIVITLCSSLVYATQYDPGPGKTRLLIGQTFQSEYQNYLSGTNLTPQGSSHYATFYLGKIEQGDDHPNANFLDWVRNNNYGEHALVALSIKDNTAAGGYGQMTNNAGNGFNSNAIWEALNDINSGAWDSSIDDFATIMKKRPDTRFFIRIGYEVSLLLFGYNGEGYVIDWLNDAANSGINVFENPDAVAEMDRQAYINAYNYIANRLKNINNVTNADFVFHPVRGFFDTKWLYPGDQYVDWVAFSVFNNDICLEVNGTFNCQGQQVDPNLAQSVQFAQDQGKPIMVAEAAVQAPASNSESGFIDYLNRLDNFIKTFDVRVLAYINSDWPAHGWGAEWGDSRVEVRNSVLNHWLNVYGNDTRYIHGTSSPNPIPPDSAIELFNGVSLSNLAATQGDSLKFYIDLPTEVSNLDIRMSGGTGDADLYTRFSAEPTSNIFDCRPYTSGNNETCIESTPNSGRWYVNVTAYKSYSNVNLVATFDSLSENTPPTANANGPYNGTVTAAVAFSSNGSSDPDGSIVNYFWSFGDGSTSSSANPGHTYHSAGTYTVMLTVTDDRGSTNTSSTTAIITHENPVNETYLAPTNGSTIMILGQDLLSVVNYQNSSAPPIGGITTYVAFYEILNDTGTNGIVNGALGFNTSDQPNNIDIDWGAGPLNAYNAAIGFPNSTLQIGLSIAEGNNGDLWCGGCLAQIVNGQKNAEINQLADFFLAIPNTAVYLRIGYEFDGVWNNGYSNANTYKAAYQKIVDGLRAKGVTNVAYVWQSSASPIDDQLEGTFENISQWYPGDDYVDWVGLSWFLLPGELPPLGGSPATQDQLADNVLDFARNHNKAVMIAEATPQGYDLNLLTLRNISPVWDGVAGENTQNLSATQIWDHWFVPFFDYIHSNRDIIKAVSYINADWDSQGKWAPPYQEGYWGNTQIQANEIILNKWNSELNSSFWTHGGPSINQAVGLE